MYNFLNKLKTPWDTKYFDTFPEQDPFYPPEKRSKRRKDINYPGYTYNRDLENQRGGLLHALEVFDAIKQSTNQGNEKFNIVDDLDEKNIKNERLLTERDDSYIRDEYINKENHMVSKSPENKNGTEKIQINNPVMEKKALKGVNVIPIKPLNTRENNLISNNLNDRIKADRFSPKPKDIKITTTAFSPKQKLMPSSTKPTTEKIAFETKYSSKIYKDITNNMAHKSPSPKLENRSIKK